MNCQFADKSEVVGHFIIDATPNSLIIDQKCLVKDKKHPKCENTSVFNHTVHGKHQNQGRWTKTEHLIFLACIIEFGRDWKMIEEFVQTRSSAQARSHAQKVLRRTDKSGIVREIMALKTKLNFDPKAHK